MRRLVTFLLLLCCIMAASAGSRADSSAAPRPPAAAKAEAPLVLIVAPRDGGGSRGSEAFADWQAYRDDFLARRAEGVRIVQLAPQVYRRRVAQPRLSGEFATLFVRGNGHRALLHDGMILEPQAYLLGMEYLRGDTVPAEAVSYGFREVTFRRR